MKKIDLGKTIQLVANLGVIAGILFLGLELRQNNQLLRAEAISTVLETRLSRQERVLENESVAALYAKNQRNEVLTDEDLIRMQASRNRGFIGWQRDFFLFQEGILPEEYFRANFPVMKNAFSDTGGSYSGFQHWETWKTNASPAYREFIEQCILSDCETIPK